MLLELLFVTGRSRRHLSRWLPTAAPNRSGYVRKLYGGFLMVKRGVLDAAGWFDERYFMYAEDADLSRTILSLGSKLYYCSEATIVHVTGGTTAAASSTFSTLMKAESVNRMIAKYEGRSGAVLHRAVVFAGSAIRAAALTLLRLLSIGRGTSRRGELAAAWAGQVGLLLWAAGLRAPSIPSARRTDPDPSGAPGERSS